MLIVFDAQIRRGLSTLLALARVRGLPWIVLSALIMIAQTVLSTVPVVAIVPLLQLFSAPSPLGFAAQWVANMIGTSKPEVLIPVFALSIGVVYLVSSGLSVLLTWWQSGRISTLGVRAATELLRRYASEPYASHRTRSNAEVIRNMGLVVSSVSALANVLTIYTSALTLAGICLVLLIASPLVTILTIVLFGASMMITQRVLRPAQRRAGEEGAEADLQGWFHMLPLIEGFREARLTNSADRFVGGYEQTRLRSMRAGRVMSTLGAVPSAVSQVVFAFAVAVIAAVLFATGSAADAITTLGLFAAAAMRAIPTMNLLAATVGNVRSAEPGLKILADASEDLDVEEAFQTTLSAGRPYRGDIVLDRVTFEYPDASAPVIHDIDLVIARHETTAIVGSSGAGKSTLIDIVLGLLEPSSGTVSVGGKSIFDDKAGWYRTLAVVPQEVFLLNDTLEANVTFGHPATDDSRESVRRALRLAQLDSLVHSLPNGLQTVIGERGTRLSGGQRQRLGLARALYREPEVLLLDEATSALDNATEAKITKALKSLHGKVTIIVVAHRLSTVRNADKLVFLQAGSIAAEGTFDEVESAVPEFAHLVKLGKL